MYAMDPVAVVEDVKVEEVVAEVRKEVEEAENPVALVNYISTHVGNTTRVALEYNFLQEIPILATNHLLQISLTHL